jgi:cytochrome c-type biogenesis protein CcmH/NrfG
MAAHTQTGSAGKEKGHGRFVVSQSRQGEPMSDRERHSSWHRIVVAGALAALAWSAAYAKDSTGYVKEAEQYLAQGDLKAAEIQLRNAIRDAPQDPVLRAQLAEVHLQLGDAVSAEREARAARERNGNEADYLPVLADALLRRGNDVPAVVVASPANSVIATPGCPGAISTS